VLTLKVSDERLSPSRRHAWILGLVLVGTTASSLRAQDRRPEARVQDEKDPASDPESDRLVEILLRSGASDGNGDDWKASENAERALERRGVLGARSALAARAKARSAKARERLERVIRSVVSALVLDLQRPLLEPAARHAAAAAVGGAIASLDPSGEASIGSETVTEAELDQSGQIGREEPKSGYEARLRARGARAALASLGPAGLGVALEVPPVRPLAVERQLYVIFAEVYEREARRALKAAGHADEARALREAYWGRSDLAVMTVAEGMRDPREPVRSLFQTLRDDALVHALTDLDAADPDQRESAQDELYRLSDLARPTLDRIARGDDKAHASAESRLSAARLSRRIRFRLSRALVRKLGHELEGYAELPFDKRRSVAFELERLGGQDAVPALRALLVEEPTEEVRAVAALGLYKQNDWVGAEWLHVHGQTVNLISKRDLAGLILDQGNKYLQAKKFEQAEKQYRQVLEIEPKNEVALYNLACCYSLWGRTDEAIDYFKRSIEAGFDDVDHMEKDTDLDPIRDDPRYKAAIDALKAKKAKDRGDTEGDKKPEGDKKDQ
jgi:tetratricopeptide (TPR) repeat protein